MTKRIVDLLLTIALLLMMSYSLIGEAVPEWIGVGMFLLFIAHILLNRRWIGSVGKGRYSAYRIVQTVLAALCFLMMMGSMASGIVLSNYIFSDPPLRGWSALGRQVHMICAYWGFLVMGLHLGLHWGMLLSTAKKFPATQTWIFRGLGWLTAGYGAYALWKRGLPVYLFLRTHFAFFDYEEPILFFFADYLAIMGLFVFCGYYGSRLLGRRRKQQEENRQS